MSEDVVSIVVDNMLRIDTRQAPKFFVKALVRKFIYDNPDYEKKKRLGFSLFGLKARISTAHLVGDELQLYRGSAGGIREVAKEAEIRLQWQDRRHTLEATGLTMGSLVPRPNQQPVVDIMVAKQQGIVLGGTGTGKTAVGLAAAVKLGQPTLVIVWNAGLAKQWAQKIEEFGILPARKIGMIGASKRKLGPITIGMVQTLSRGVAPEVAKFFGTVIVDECQRTPSRTMAEVLNALPAKNRFGLTADERRRDGMEFLAYDTLGPVIAKIETAETTVEPKIIVVPTDYVDATYEDDKKWTTFVDRITQDPARNALIEGWVRHCLGKGRRVLLFTERRAAAILWAKTVQGWGYKSVCLIGSGSDKEKQEWVQNALIASAEGRVAFASATSFADVGHDLRAMDTAVITVPVQKNMQRVEQMVGRVVRPFEGKDEALVLYFWDRWIEGVGRKKKWKNFGFSGLGKKWPGRVEVAVEVDENGPA